MRPARRAWWLGLSAGCLALAGCRTLADHIARPQGQALLPASTLAWIDQVAGVRQAYFHASDGERLAYRDLAPGRRGLRFEFQRREGGMAFSLDFEGEAAPVPAGAARGTVVLLHGWGLEGSAMLPWALALAEHGWRAIVPDLRGHGRSGASPGFGPREGEDIAGLLATLRGAGGLDDGPVLLLGVSHGAVAALHAGARLGDQVAGIVAISPYASARQGIHGVIDAARRMPATGLRGRAARAWMRWRYTPAAVDAAMRVAGRRMGAELAAVETGPAVDALRACTLVLHGDEDGVFETADVQALAQRSPQARFIALDGENHLTAPLRLDLLAAPLAAWFAQLPRAPCPAFESPAAAAAPLPSL